MNLVQATAKCTFCGREFHQIDGTDDRALAIVRGALAEHIEADHSEGARRG